VQVPVTGNCRIWRKLLGTIPTTGEYESKIFSRKRFMFNCRPTFVDFFRLWHNVHTLVLDAEFFVA